MIGKTIGLLTVTEFAGHSKKSLAVWECRCACGQTIKVIGAHLRARLKYSCGCVKRPANFVRDRNYGVGLLADVLCLVEHPSDVKPSGDLSNDNIAAKNSMKPEKEKIECSMFGRTPERRSIKQGKESNE
jgi:hypothetical protein